MEITQEQYEKIEKYLPRQRGNVSMSNLQLINAILYVTENGCKWRALPEKYGNWHTIYVRMNRWSKNGVLQRVFEALQIEGIIKIKVEAVCLDSTTVKVHPNGTGALKKAGNSQSDVPEEDSPRKFIWSPHLTDRLCFIKFCMENPVDQIVLVSEMIIKTFSVHSTDFADVTDTDLGKRHGAEQCFHRFRQRLFRNIRICQRLSLHSTNSVYQTAARTAT